MHAIAQTAVFNRAAKAAGLSDEEIADLIDYLAEQPLSGEAMRGTGGCRKIRWKPQNSGKSGGFRIITFYSGPQMPVFLLAAYKKSQKVNLTKAQCADLKKLTEQIVEEYKSRVTELKRAKGASA